MRVRSALAIGLSSMVIATAATTGSASAAPTPKPTRNQLAAAMLTFPQIKRIALKPLSGPGATYDGTFDPSLRFQQNGNKLISYTFADSYSPKKKDGRSVMMVVTYGHKPTSKVQCRIDEGSPQTPAGPNACYSVRRPSGAEPVGVSYALKVAPDVSVLAYVSDDARSLKPHWTPPSVAKMSSIAKELVTAQVARLRAKGLLPAG